MSNYVKNPETGRLIKVGGPTYIKLKGKISLQSLETVEKEAPQARLSAKPLSSVTLKQMAEMPVHKFDLKQILKQTRQPHLVRRLKKQVPMAQKKEGRGSKTRGWAGVAPHRGRERHTLKQKCGDKCFLIPEKEAFPICPKCLDKSCTCQLSCQGLLSAKIRAHQYKYTDLYQNIDQLLKDKC